MGWMSCGSRERDTRPVKIEPDRWYIQGQTNVPCPMPVSTAATDDHYVLEVPFVNRCAGIDSRLRLRKLPVLPDVSLSPAA